MGGESRQRTVLLPECCADQNRISRFMRLSMMTSNSRVSSSWPQLLVIPTTGLKRRASEAAASKTTPRKLELLPSRRRPLPKLLKMMKPTSCCA